MGMQEADMMQRSRSQKPGALQKQGIPTDILPVPLISEVTPSQVSGEKTEAWISGGT